LSLGIAVFPSQGSDVEELIRVADKAMYEAKGDGGNRAKVAVTVDAHGPDNVLDDPQVQLG
jgi:predicted signal transduction protein with EAL and GGDEF domain